MRFKLVENLIEEDFEIIPGLTFSDLMNAAENGDGDLVLNPPGVEDTIDLPESQWDLLYDAMFIPDDDNTIYTSNEWDKHIADENAFIRRYNCV